MTHQCEQGLLGDSVPFVHGVEPPVISVEILSEFVDLLLKRIESLILDGLRLLSLCHCFDDDSNCSRYTTI